MEIIETFKTPIAKFYLQENLKLLIEFVNKLKKEKKSRQQSNEGGFQSGDLDLNLKELRSLSKNISVYANEFKKKFYYKSNIKIINMWINVNQKNSYNLVHNHPFSSFSGVFYIQTPANCGNIDFRNDSKIEHFMPVENFTNYGHYNSLSWTLPVKENILYLFPAWLTHTVKSNQSNKERISVSFNIR